ncbi:4-(cytidine 5'-diphospho)-2-C-methyl-D-erythritol kinase [Ferrovibrio sp.]|uniref:4-(cytidine 5'-diphospho)-2-C-methyl-D-erythritol kinase n=1 Tax=Ferrovibrio sp. TaxID=1917215 RepID=UPI003D0E0182
MSEAAGVRGAWRLAPAKVNLFLHITARRPDGYHELESLVVFARDEAAADRVTVTPAADLTLAIDGPFAAGLAADDGNLVLRAAHLLRGDLRRDGNPLGAKLTLTKNLPVASGIGGGSADAAAVLHLLNEQWRLGHDTAALARIGLRLGADLPVCVQGKPAVMTGIGEQVAPLDSLPPAWLVLVNPGIALPTREVFMALNGATGPAQPLPRPPASAADLAILLRERRNDLEAPARFLSSAIDPVLAALKAQSGCLLARLSGSGATCFGFFAEQRLAEHAARMLARAHPDWWVVATAI